MEKVDKMSREDFEKRQKLEEIGNKLEEKRKEISKLEAKKDKLESESRKEDNKVEQQVSYLKNNLRINVQKISSEKPLLIEEGGNKDFFFLDIYLVEDSSPMFLGRWPCDADGYDDNSSRIMCNRRDDPDLAPFKFLKEELEPNSDHEYDGYDLNHRTWIIEKAEDLRAFENFIHNSHYREIYRKDGWEGLNNLVQVLKNRLNDVYPDVSDLKLLEEDGIRYPISPFDMSRRFGSKFNYPVHKKIIKYGLENDDLTVKEAITALKLDDQKFAEQYERKKNIIQDTLDDLKEAFGHYLNEKEAGGG